MIRVLQTRDRKIYFGSRPKIEEWRQIRNRGVKLVVTLLRSSEGLPFLVRAVRDADLAWLNWPCEWRREPEFQMEWLELIREFSRIFLPGDMFIHCSEGRHRTPMFVAHYLVSIGRSWEEALESIASAEIVRDWRKR